MGNFRIQFKLLIFTVLGMVLVAGNACDDTATNPPHQESGFELVDPLEPPPDGEGVQIQFGPVTMAAASEVETCYTMELDADQDLWVRKFEGRMQSGSHHFILFESPVDLPDNVHYECFAGVPAGENPFDVDRSELFDSRWIVGLQSPGQLETPDFPESGMALHVSSGAQLILNSHYINTTEQEITRQVWLNFWTLPADEVRTEVEFVAMINPLIALPDGRATTVTADCAMPADRMAERDIEELRILLLTAHMHKLGTGFRAYKLHAGGEQELIYETDSWSDPDVDFYVEEPLRLGPDDSIRFECDYYNDTGNPVFFGMTGDDEMCNLFGAYAPSIGGNLSCF